MDLGVLAKNGQQDQEHFMLVVAVVLGELLEDQQLQVDLAVAAPALGTIQLSQLVAQILVVVVAQPGQQIQLQ
jgi:hypothetical protein